MPYDVTREERLPSSACVRLADAASRGGTRAARMAAPSQDEAWAAWCAAQQHMQALPPASDAPSDDAAHDAAMHAALQQQVRCVALRVAARAPSSAC